MEKTERNNEICFLFQEYRTIKEIALQFNISQATIREILIRKFGVKTYLQIRKSKIKITAKRYNFTKYLSKRKIYDANTLKTKKRIIRRPLL